MANLRNMFMAPELDFLPNRKIIDLTSYSPLFFKTANLEERKGLAKILEQNPGLRVFDTIQDQLGELIKIRNPAEKISGQDLIDRIYAHLNGTHLDHYGVWVYYPWSCRLVHTLDESEFVELRTNRNLYRITPGERDLLGTKKIGIIGLSVGQSIAITLALGRIGGELRLADFDQLELTNLNRIRTGIHNLNLSKVVAAAREISEIDPFLKITCFTEGVIQENLEEFLTSGGNLDLLIEECDSLDIKILSRFRCRDLGIPVIMHTTDPGMIDIERFDLEPSRPILHGLAEGITPSSLGNLTNEEKIPYVLRIVGAENISVRGKASMFEINQTISTWPQLASSVVAGGGEMTQVAHWVLLNQLGSSGRYFLNPEVILGMNGNQEQERNHSNSIPEAPPPLKKTDLEGIIKRLKESKAKPEYQPKDEQIEDLVKAACLAPSGGNVQPWKWLWDEGYLYLFMEEHYSSSLLDFHHKGSYLAHGAALQNILELAGSLGLETHYDLFPNPEDTRLVARIYFSRKKEKNLNKDGLSEFIGVRCTNRKKVGAKEIPCSTISVLKTLESEYPGSSLSILTDREKISKIAELLGQGDRIRSSHPRAHQEAFFHELRWSQEENLRYRDGLDIETLELRASDRSALQLARDYRPIYFLKTMKLGKALEKSVREGIKSSGAVGLITMPGNDPKNLIQAGRLMEKVWLTATRLNIAFQPNPVSLFLFERVASGDHIGFLPHEVQELYQINSGLDQLFDIREKSKKVFLFRLLIADQPLVKSLRRNLEELYFKH